MLLAFFQWCEGTAIGQTVRNSVWLFPIIESLHLVSLAILGGALLVTDLRMLGMGLTGQTIAEVGEETKPWLTVGVVAMITTGTCLFLSEALKCYYNPSFWVKILTLPVALLFTLTVRATTARSGGHQPTLRHRLVAIISLSLWFTVAAAGRWIGFSS